MPASSAARARRPGAGVRYVRQAGVLYGVGLRQLVLVVPIVSVLLLLASGLVAALFVAAVLYSLDRFGDEGREG
jgi:hypothetical protein